VPPLFVICHPELVEGSPSFPPLSRGFSSFETELDAAAEPSKTIHAPLEGMLQKHPTLTRRPAMDGDKVSSVLNAIRRAKPLDLFLLSFLLLSFVFEEWTEVLTKLGVGQRVMYVWLVGVLLGYATCVVAFVFRSYRRQKAQFVRDQIVAYLQSRTKPIMSFDRVRAKLQRPYDDDYLDSVIREFSTELRHARLKGGGKGVARVTEEDAGDEN
jgi:hypothetical protein